MRINFKKGFSVLIKLILIINFINQREVSFGQDIYLTYNSMHVKCDTAINVDLDKNSSIDVPVLITNKGTSTLNLKVKKKEKKIVIGSENTFCFDKCYQPGDSISKSSLLINPGESITNFQGDYNPKGHAGTTTIKYIFFDVNNANDSASVTINYNANSDGIGEYSNSNEAGIKIEPNPANEYVSIKINQDIFKNEELDICDMSGKLISKYKISKNRNEIVINTISLSGGAYLIIFKADGRIISKNKLYIIH